MLSVPREPLLRPPLYIFASVFYQIAQIRAMLVDKYPKDLAEVISELQDHVNPKVWEIQLLSWQPERVV